MRIDDQVVICNRVYEGPRELPINQDPLQIETKNLVEPKQFLPQE